MSKNSGIGFATAQLFQTEGVSGEIKDGFAKENPMKRMRTSEEIAKVVLFLTSDDSFYIIGINLTVDGGMT